MHKKLNIVFLAIAFIVVVGAIIAGFFLIGSPAQQRRIALDGKRLSDLSAIAQQLYGATQGTIYNGGSKALPGTLADLASLSNNGYLEIKDPETDAPYTYEITSSSTYDLCATFETNSSTSVPSDVPPQENNSFWNHPAGNYCFSFTTKQYPASYYYDGPSPVNE